MYDNLNKSFYIVSSSCSYLLRRYDSFEQANFTLNEYGTIRSDFAELIASQSQEQLLAAVNRMKELYQKDQDQHLSFDEKMRYVTPRSCQSPRELDLLEQALINYELDKYGKLNEEYQKRKAELEQRQKDFDDFVSVRRAMESGSVSSNSNDKS